MTVSHEVSVYNNRLGFDLYVRTTKIAFDSFDTVRVFMSALFCSLAGMMSYPFGYSAVNVMSPRP